MPWIDVPTAKKFLHKSAQQNVDDEVLQFFVDGACQVIENLKGHVDVTDPITYTARSAWITSNRPPLLGGYYLSPPVPRPDYVIALPETPVADVQSVTRLSDGVVLANDLVSDPLTNGWRLLDTVLYVPTSGDFTVVYTAGRNPVPANFTLAALELAAHLWRGSQLNQNSGRPPVAGDQMMVLPHMASALPYRVRELLGIFGNVVNDLPVIA